VALQNRLQGGDQKVEGQRRIVAEAKASRLKVRTEYFLVTGRLIGSQDFKGARRYVYSAACNNAGYAAVSDENDDENPPHRSAIRYDGKDLCFDVLFATQHDATMFSNEVVPIIFGFSPQDVDLSPPVVVKAPQVANIHSWDYRSDDELGSARCGNSDSTVYSNAEPDSDLARFQSIEVTGFIQAGVADSAHLVHKSALEAQGIEDTENNRLALSPTLHRFFDGRRNQHGYSRFPKVLIEPAPAFTDTSETATATDSRGVLRERVWIKVSTFEASDSELIASYFKEGTQAVGTSGGFVEFFTFVFVTDREEFYSNLEWKAAETRSVWEDARSRR